MKLDRIFVVLLCVSLGIFAFAQTTTSAPKPLTPTQQALVDAEKGFVAAAKKGDAEYFKRTLTDDYSMVGVDGQLHDRQETLGDLSSGGVNLMPYNIKVVELDADAAIVTYDVVMQVPPAEDQGAPPRYQHWSSTWIKQGDQWKLKFQQTTPTHWGDW
jgi:hypothetical protein